MALFNSKIVTSKSKLTDGYCIKRFEDVPLQKSSFVGLLVFVKPQGCREIDLHCTKIYICEPNL